MILPDGRFRDLWRALDARGHARDALERLRVAYDEPHRVYHTASHIGACLRVLEDPLVRPLSTRIEEVEAALWFHDAVYDTHASDNEEQSALLADEILRSAGVAVDVVARIATYIRATESHAAGSPDAKVVVDVDLSILGEDPAVFARFEDEIRREYAWVDKASYARGRAAVLRRFQERPFIYATSLFRARLEARARASIAASLNRSS
jgi:predicted metal-dependent HD superfamily phosphohydrolase